MSNRAVSRSLLYRVNYRCDVTAHCCGEACDFSDKKGCQTTCMKIAEHSDEGHICSARNHQCGEVRHCDNTKLRDNNLWIPSSLVAFRSYASITVLCILAPTFAPFPCKLPSTRLDSHVTLQASCSTAMSTMRYTLAMTLNLAPSNVNFALDYVPSATISMVLKMGHFIFVGECCLSTLNRSIFEFK